MCKPEVFDQIQNGGGGHLEKHIKRNNSVIFPPIFTEFGSTGSEKLGKQNKNINRKFKSKSKMAAAAILESHNSL